MSITEVAKAAGEKWKNLDEDVKKKYEDKHKEMKEKYDEEYKEWLEDGGKEAMKAAKKEGKEGKSSKSPKKKVTNKEALQNKEGSEDCVDIKSTQVGLGNRTESML